MRPTTADSLGWAKRRPAQMLQVTVSTFRRFGVGRHVCDPPQRTYAPDRTMSASARKADRHTSKAHLENFLYFSRCGMMLSCPSRRPRKRCDVPQYGGGIRTTRHGNYAVLARDRQRGRQAMKTTSAAAIAAAILLVSSSIASAQVCALGLIAAAAYVSAQEHRELTSKEAMTCGISYLVDKPEPKAKPKKVARRARHQEK